MKVIRTIQELRAYLRSTHQRAFVPTMGNLHQGHLELVRRAKQFDANTIVSIFVNPLQFGPQEDFASYPRTLEEDLAQLEALQVDYVFAPSEAEFYPQIQSFFVQPPEALADILEGAFRPGFFKGVCTVVMKLFQCVQPQYALFGKKDYQQQMIIRHMCEQFALPIQIITHDIIRASDGLALSSRNRYLSLTERQQAPQLYQALSYIAQQIQQGNHHFESLEQATINQLAQHNWKVDYISIRNQHDLSPAKPNSKYVALAAATLGTTRLIDNIEI